jgi:EAL domain-containing protein (putative c-di-GMP-specific phosphodiesterase class I)
MGFKTYMSKKWVLEGYFGEESLQRIPLSVFPAKVGRDSSFTVAIEKSEISRLHAQFFNVDGQLELKDLGSTNGTFVNNKPLKGQTNLRHGDVVHFASYSVRVLELILDTPEHDSSMTMINVIPRSDKLPTGLNELQILLEKRAIKSQFQPIVHLDGSLYGYEVLGRGSLPELPISPMELFRIAESMPGKDAELSLLMRDCGVEQACQQSLSHRMFMNTHPSEIKDIDFLLGTMRKLREKFESLPMVLEIHEDAITNIEIMKKFSKELTAMNIELAYDDFGAGQARLMEMIEVPVKYIKFDISLIRGLHKAPESKQKMVAALAAMTQSMGIQTLAEGVEEIEELKLCKQMNFDLIQGYYFGKPALSLNYENNSKV